MKSTMTQQGDEGMDALYQDGPESKGNTESVDQENREEMDHQASVPVKVLMGKHTEPLKEGDEVVVKIDKVDGENALISYSETKPSEIGETPPNEMSADDELEELGKQY